MTTLLASINPDFLTEERRRFLEENTGGRRLLLTQDRDEMARHADDIEITIGQVPRDLLPKLPKLVWHQQFGTGTEWLQKHPEAIEHPFTLTNCSDNHCVVLAEHLLSLMLAFARALPSSFRAQQDGQWRRETDHGPGRFELRGKTLLLAGVGSIGQELAKRAKAFEMRLIGLRKDPSRSFEGVEKMFGMNEIHKALPEADMVASSLPHTPDTRKLFDADAFAAMKPSAFFFNVGRGATVDEAALIEALRSEQIAGAGLDVFETEPLPESSPLWAFPNVIITPHSGGSHHRLYETWLEVAFDNLQRFNANKPLRNQVDKRSGY